MIVANNSNQVIEARSICNNEVATIKLRPLAVMKVPDNCAILAKTFEISRSTTNVGYSNEVNIGTVDKITIRNITRNNRMLSKIIPKFELIDDVSKNNFENNNNDTHMLLNQVKTKNFSTSETALIASTSSMSILAVILVLVIVTLFAYKRCNSGKANRPEFVIVGNEIVGKRNQKMEKNEIDETVVEIENCNSSAESHNASDKRPPFQRKNL